MFSFISINWGGQPLVSYEAVLKLIGSTRTTGGLRVRARLDRRAYETGVTISEQEVQTVNLKRHETLPDWNYTIRPHARH